VIAQLDAHYVAGQENVRPSGAPAAAPPELIPAELTESFTWWEAARR
jgi:hypothetical protein